jgi:hypothetical protein
MLFGSNGADAFVSDYERGPTYMYHSMTIWIPWATMIAVDYGLQRGAERIGALPDPLNGFPFSQLSDITNTC